MRYAFFGGSFDPPHLGHLHIARVAAERMRLGRVLLAPVGRQPLKSHEAAPFADRMRMLTLLAEQSPGLEASAIDAPLDARLDASLGTPPAAPLAGPSSRPNYTVDTLARLRAELPQGATLFLLAGADSFLTLPRWYRPEALLQPAERGGLLTAWILAARPGFALESLQAALPAGYLLGDQQETVGPVLTRQVWDEQGKECTPLHLLPDLDDPSTATEIREAFARAQDAPHLLPAVTQYIRDHGLYRVLG
ncbi:nicotinate-nicotinamide nucleotide adenylyltransferase [Acidipila sp. EB88]|uniref:nicotinate-nicotinamide nucleotide adenylyltransferase n=1 Tax=Acidipila sp. EB88 TaxID=2305226 RepID=UPI000F6027EE|nr:nicotinate-nicotinamide nucleotide adenylyltransferase [Acidipila sp. EB88]RRA48152.1 nicotinate-nicotinamide nucleotide adenylyltransferase [Acidipila sp. EB88]